MACRNRQTDLTDQEASMLANVLQRFRENNRALEEREERLRTRVREMKAMAGVREETGSCRPCSQQQDNKKSYETIDCPYECWEDTDSQMGAMDCPYQCWDETPTLNCGCSDTSSNSDCSELDIVGCPPQPPIAASDISFEVTPTTSETSSIESLTEDDMVYLQQLQLLAIDEQEALHRIEVLKKRERDIMRSAKVTRDVVDRLQEIFDGPPCVCPERGQPAMSLQAPPTPVEAPPTEPWGGVYPQTPPTPAKVPPPPAPPPPIPSQIPPTEPWAAEYPKMPPVPAEAPPIQPWGEVSPKTPSTTYQPPPTQVPLSPISSEAPPTQPWAGDYPMAPPVMEDAPSAQVWAQEYSQGPEELEDGCFCELREGLSQLPESSRPAPLPPPLGEYVRSHADSVASARTESINEWAKSIALSDGISQVVSRVMESAPPVSVSHEAPPKPPSPMATTYPSTKTEARIMQNEDPLQASSRCSQVPSLCDIPESGQQSPLGASGSPPTIVDILQGQSITPENARLVSMSLTDTKRKLSALVKHVNECPSCEKTIKQPLKDIDRKLLELTEEFRQRHDIELKLEPEGEDVPQPQVPAFLAEVPPGVGGSEVSQFTIMAKQTSAKTKLLPDACSVSEYTLLPDMTESTRTILNPNPNAMSNESTWIQPSHTGDDWMAVPPLAPVRESSLPDAAVAPKAQSTTLSLGFMVEEAPMVQEKAVSEGKGSLAGEVMEAAPEPSLTEEVEPEPSLADEVHPEPSLVEEAEPEPSLVEEAEPEPSLADEAEPEPSLADEAEPVPSLVEEVVPESDEPLPLVEEEPEVEAAPSLVVKEDLEPEAAPILVEELEPEPEAAPPLVEELEPQPLFVIKEEPGPEPAPPLVEQEEPTTEEPTSLVETVEEPEQVVEVPQEDQESMGDDSEPTCPRLCPKPEDECEEEDKPIDTLVVLGTGETYLDDLAADIQNILSQTGVEPETALEMHGAGDMEEGAEGGGGDVGVEGEEEQPTTEEPGSEAVVEEPTVEEGGTEGVVEAEEVAPGTAEGGVEEEQEPIIKEAPPEIPAVLSAQIEAPPSQPVSVELPKTTAVPSRGKEEPDNEIGLLRQVLLDQTQQIRMLVDVVKQFPLLNLPETCACNPCNLGVESVMKMKQGLEKLKEATEHASHTSNQEVAD